jgi:hypothetical protein
MITLVALLALLAQNTHISAAKALGVTFGASLALWLAHCFSEAVGAHYMVRRRLRRVEMRKILIQELSVVVGVILPVGLLICATFEWIETQTALRMAAWAGVGILSLSGWAVAEAGGLSFVSRFMTAAAYGALGAAIVILELAFTH